MSSSKPTIGRATMRSRTATKSYLMVHRGAAGTNTVDEDGVRIRRKLQSLYLNARRSLFDSMAVTAATSIKMANSLKGWLNIKSVHEFSFSVVKSSALIGSAHQGSRGYGEYLSLIHI